MSLPLIVVYNLGQDDYDEKKIGQFEEAMLGATKGMPELESIHSSISFSFPRDPSVISNDITVIIIVELLVETSMITPRVKHRLAADLAIAFRSVPGNENRDVAVAVRPFNPENDGFCFLRK